MIKVDYSGLNWKKIGEPTKMTHRNCGGQIWYCYKHDSYFCSLCGHWTEAKCKDNKCQYCRHRPINAITVLNKELC